MSVQKDKRWFCDGPDCDQVLVRGADDPYAPDGWFELTVRVPRGDRKGYRRHRGHFCSGRCAAQFISDARGEALVADLKHGLASGALR